MNNFYASVERLYRPDLVGKPIAVCGDEAMRHGIVLAKSEEAKRMGVKTGDTVWQAREKCPGITLLPPRFERYVKYSRLAQEIYCEYTDLVESFGMDECWLDVTASRLAFGDGVSIGEEIRKRILRELGLTVSVGVSFNKIFAKLGSDLKKPNALTHIPSGRFREIVWPLPVGEMMGVGRKSEADLRRFGIDTIGKLATADSAFLQMRLGKNGTMLKESARGNDTTPVLPCHYRPPLQSIGHGFTVPKDLEQREEVWLLILELCQEIGEKLRYHGLRAGGVALDLKTRSLFSASIQKTLPFSTDCTMTLAKEAFRLFQERYAFTEPLRSVTVRAISLSDRSGGVQLSLFSQSEDLRAEKLDRVTDAIRRRWGKGALKNASLLVGQLPDSHGYIPFRGTAPLDQEREMPEGHLPKDHSKINF